MSTTRKTSPFKGYEELASFGKENVEAMVRSGAVLAEAAQEFNKAWFGLARSAVDRNIAAGEALVGCKTPGEAFEVQSGLAKSQAETAVAEGRRLSELSLKVADDAAEPIAERINAAVDKFSKSIAV